MNKNKKIIMFIIFTLLLPMKTKANNMYSVVKYDEYGKITDNYGDFDNYGDANVKRRSLGRSENYAVIKDNKVLAVNYGVVNLGNTNNNHNIKSSTTGKSGYTNGAYGADSAFIGFYGERTIEFRLAGDNFTVNKNDNIELLPYNKNLNLSYYKNEGGMIKHYISTNVRGQYAYPINLSPSPHYLQENTKYYSYDGHYFYTDYKVMINDLINERVDNAVNKDYPFYNYYQFLPYRTETSYSLNEFRKWFYDVLEYHLPWTSGYGANLISRFNQTENAFISSEQMYGANALLSYGIAKNESADGYSQIAQHKYNLFGHAAFDSSPYSSATGYNSNSASVFDHANIWMSSGYLNVEDWRYNGTHLGDKASGVNVKYASDPYWGEKAAANYYRFDREFGLRDFNKYTLGINRTETEVLVYKNVGDSTPLYSLGKQINRPFVLLGKVSQGGEVWYKIQSELPLDKNKNLVNSGEYDFDNSVAYIKGSVIKHITGKSIEDTNVINSLKPQENTVDKTTTEIVNTLGGQISGGYILNLKTDIKPSTIPSQLNNTSISVESKNKDKISSYDKITLRENGVEKTFVLIVKGDVNGDGNISVRDVGYVLNHIEGTRKLTEQEYLSANIMNTKEITVRVIGYILNHIEGVKPIR